MKYTDNFYVIYTDLLSEDKFNAISTALTNKGINLGYHISDFSYKGYKYFRPSSYSVYIRVEKNVAYLDNNKQNLKTQLSIEEFEKSFLGLGEYINYEIY